MDAKQKLDKVLRENPDPSKWTKWIRLIIAILSAILGALAENSLDVCASVAGLF